MYEGEVCYVAFSGPAGYPSLADVACARIGILWPGRGTIGIAQKRSARSGCNTRPQPIGTLRTSSRCCSRSATFTWLYESHLAIPSPSSSNTKQLSRRLCCHPKLVWPIRWLRGACPPIVSSAPLAYYQQQKQEGDEE